MTPMIRTLIAAAAAILPVLLVAGPGASQPLRIGLKEDPDILDPSLSRTFVGRIVFMSLCDKLFDINERLEVVPQLATGYRWETPTSLVVTLREGVRFHDGEVMDAEAVRYSMNRHLTMQGSYRRSEIGDLDRVEVIDPRTVRMVLKVPSASFLSMLTDRAGMIVSPRASEALGRNFGTRPVCAGPFRFVERVAQERIVVERFADYWDAANIHFDRVTYMPIPDDTVRLANLQADALDFAERIAPDDMPTVQRARTLRAASVPGLGYQSLRINIGNGPRADNPLGRDARVRQAFELSLDRAAINQVVYGGMYTPTRQPFPPANPFHIADFPPTERDVGRARALLREAGVTTPIPVELTVPNAPDQRQVGEVIQSMAAEAGFAVTLRAMEFASSLQAASRGEFQAYLLGWSGRVDPDGNTYTFIRTGGAQNDGRYSNPEVDGLLDAARGELDLAKRRDLYARMLDLAIGRDVGILYLWHPTNIMAHQAHITGYRPVSDWMIRLQGMRGQ